MAHLQQPGVLCFQRLLRPALERLWRTLSFRASLTVSSRYSCNVLKYRFAFERRQWSRENYRPSGTVSKGTGNACSGLKLQGFGSNIVSVSSPLTLNITGKPATRYS